MEQFSNRAILKSSISQMEQFSNGAILKCSILGSPPYAIFQDPENREIWHAMCLANVIMVLQLKYNLMTHLGSDFEEVTRLALCDVND